MKDIKFKTIIPLIEQASEQAEQADEEIKMLLDIRVLKMYLGYMMI